jgi:hypothetical protein
MQKANHRHLLLRPAANGRAVAAPLGSVMNSRRCIQIM